MVVQTTTWLAAMGVILFAAAGDWGWRQGWIFLGEIAICSFAVSFWLARHDPALLASRLSAPMQRGQRPWDRVFMAAALSVFMGWLALCAVDARRFQWSVVPLWAQGLGAVLIALSMIAVWRTFRFNTFAAPQVRMQKDRQHRVITDGPYRIVRHPICRCSGLLCGRAPAVGLLVGTALRASRRRWYGHPGAGRGTNAAE
jgi:protein-S-isoprenylcysteine O-methyltransferase Ste14